MIPGIHEVQSLAIKYSKAQLAQMAQAGMVDPTKAVMAGMMIDRISKQNIQAPQSTVAQDVMAPPQQQQMGMPPQAQQGQPQQGQPQQGQPQQAPSAGVSGIPAPNMERMAGGGIVAFGDGGDVPSYANAGYVDSTWENLKPASRPLAGSMGEFFGNMLDQGGQRVDPITGEPISLGEFMRRQEAERSKVYTPAAQAIAAQAPAAAPKKDVVPNPLAAAPAKAPAKAPGLAQPRPPISAGPAVTAPATGLGGLGQTMSEVNKASGMADLKAQYEKLPIEAEAANVREKTLAEQRPEYVPYDKYEKSLEKEAAGAEEKKADNFKMALINAGLAIAGGKSQYALSNIAEGAQVGTKQYAEGMKDLEKAAKEREKALAEIEQARNLYSDRKYDRAEALERSANERLMTSREKAITGISGITGKNLEASTAIHDTQQRIVSAENIAKLNRDSQERMANQSNATTANYYAKSLALTKQRLESADAATRAKMMKATQDASKMFLETPEYATLVKQLKGQYGDAWATNPLANSVLQRAKTTFIGQQLEAAGALIPDQSSIRDHSTF
jgi:hypothetical protein